MVQFCDALELGKPRRTRDGYLAVRARASRTGVYKYAGRDVDPENEHGLRDEATVNVLRDEHVVFDKRAVQSFIGKPITNDHPHEAVNSANWKDHSRGAIMGALKDGDYLAFDLLLMDAAAIADVEAGKRALSNGYAAELEFGDFSAPDGTKCPVRQARISDGNHVAIVDAARAGPECGISDGGNELFKTCDTAAIILDAREEPKPMPKFITLDDLKVDLSDEGAVEAAIAKLQGQAKDAQTALATAEGQVTTLTADKAALEVKVTALEQAVKDAKVTPAQLREAGKAYDKLVADAKKLVPALTITDEMNEAAVRKAVVDAKLGDKAKDYDDANILIAFDTLAAQLGDDGDQHQSFKAPAIVANDAEVADAYSQMVDDMVNASKPQTGKAA